jgi:K+-transporting ATPase KdpF subunit
LKAQDNNEKSDFSIILFYNSLINYCLILFHNSTETNMRTKIVSSLILLVGLPASSEGSAADGNNSYLIGGIIALLIMVYLIYSLIRPEKF